MKIAMLLLVLAVSVFLVARYAVQQPPLQGMKVAGDGASCLVSCARPAVICSPVKDMRLLYAGWRDLRPQSRSAVSGGPAKLWFSVYANARGMLLLALAESGDEWEWEAGWHCPYKTLRQIDYQYAGQTLYESLYVLRKADDPFPCSELSPADNDVFLVCRSKFLLFFRKMQVICEYRETVSAETARTADLNPDLLRSFEQRARSAFAVAFPDKAQFEDLRTGIVRMDADKKAERIKLNHWVGMIEHPGHQR